jgi:hypothetical protein
VALAQTSLDATTAQSSNEQGVTIKVTAKSIGAPNSRWEFAIVLDTHSADLSDDLSDDLSQSATLTTDDGRTFKPASWLGALPGGHHREGVLAFSAGAAARCDRTPDRPAGRIRAPYLSLATLTSNHKE